MAFKSIERLWRRFWIRVLVRFMRKPEADRPDWSAGPYRVLFLRHDRAGDMILSTGVMRTIARSHPSIQLEVLASPANASILEAADYVHDVVIFDKKRIANYLSTIRRLRRGRYDVVIDCMVTAPSLTTLLLVQATRARHRVGIAGRGNDAAFTLTVPPSTKVGAHMVDLLGALAAAFDVEASAVERQPAIALTREERGWAEHQWTESADRSPMRARRVLVNVSAGTPARLWPDEHYAEVMRHLRARDATSVFRVIGAPAEASRARAIATAGGGAFVPTPSIRHAFALVAACDFVFTPDTSIAHAASAFGKPATAMYLRGTAERWGLYGIVGKNVEHSESNLANLPLERVLRAIDDVWDEALLNRPS